MPLAIRGPTSIVKSMSSRFCSGCSLVALAVVLVGPFPSPTARAQSPDHRTVDLTYQIEVAPPLHPGPVSVWIPLPVEDAHQWVISTEVESPVDYTVGAESEYGNRMLHLRVETLTEPLPVTLRFRVRRHEVRAEFDGASTTLGPPLGRWLEPDRLVPLDQRIRTIALETTDGARTPLDRARRVYDYVVDTMTYDKSGTGWGRGDIYWACDARTGNCTDFHALFIGLNRAVGIPATFEIGFPLPPDRRDGQIEGYHCWAQFFLDGVGWVPVDTSEANKFPELHEYFFGAHDAHRVLFTKGRDVTLAPRQQGPPLNYFIYPYVEVGGQPYDGVTHRVRFTDVQDDAAKGDPR